MRRCVQRVGAALWNAGGRAQRRRRFDAIGCAQTGAFSEDMIPTVGFNMRKVTKGNVSIKVRCGASVCRARARGD